MSQLIPVQPVSLITTFPQFIRFKLCDALNDNLYRITSIKPAWPLKRIYFNTNNMIMINGKPWHQAVEPIVLYWTAGNPSQNPRFFRPNRLSYELYYLVCTGERRVHIGLDVKDDTWSRWAPKRPMKPHLTLYLITIRGRIGGAHRTATNTSTHFGTRHGRNAQWSCFFVPSSYFG